MALGCVDPRSEKPLEGQRSPHWAIAASATAGGHKGSPGRFVGRIGLWHQDGKCRVDSRRPESAGTRNRYIKRVEATRPFSTVPMAPKGGESRPCRSIPVLLCPPSRVERLAENPHGELRRRPIARNEQTTSSLWVTLLTFGFRGRSDDGIKQDRCAGYPQSSGFTEFMDNPVAVLTNRSPDRDLGDRRCEFLLS